MKYTNQYLRDLENIQECIPGISRLKNKSILVTGANGLIGSTIIDFFIQLNDICSANNKIYIGARNKKKAIERFGDNLSRRDIEYIDYDALRPINFDLELNYIIHSASPANPDVYIRQPVETMLSNFGGLNNILEYARTKAVERVAYISSSEVYGKKIAAGAYGEDEYGYLDILNPRACYPSAKRAAETLCVAYLEEYGVNSVIVRPGHVYGASVTSTDNRASSFFLKEAASGSDIVMKSMGDQLRSYCYVCDCVSSIMTVLLCGEAGKGYNISNPKSICTIRELAECIAQNSGCKIIFDLPTDTEKRGYNFMDNSSLESLELQKLGWKGLFDLETGIRHTLEQLR